jgi:hypothetical protein
VNMKLIECAIQTMCTSINYQNFIHFPASDEKSAADDPTGVSGDGGRGRKRAKSPARPGSRTSSRQNSPTARRGSSPTSRAGSKTSPSDASGGSASSGGKITATHAIFVYDVEVDKFTKLGSNILGSNRTPVNIAWDPQDSRILAVETTQIIGGRRNSYSNQ